MSADEEVTKCSSSEQHIRLLQTFEPLLCERLVASTVVYSLAPTLGSLEKAKYISDIQKKDGKKEAVRVLLQQLYECPENGWFQAFIDSLHESGYKHLANYILGVSGSLDDLEELETFKKLITICTPQLASIQPSQILPHLTCLTDDDIETIQVDERNDGARQATLTLLCRLVQKGGKWFREFVSALRKTNCEHLADLLDPESSDLGAIASEGDNSETIAKAKSLELEDDSVGDIVSHTEVYNSLDDTDNADLQSSNTHPMTIQNLSCNDDEEPIASLEELDVVVKEIEENTAVTSQPPVAKQQDDADRDKDESYETDDNEHDNDDPEETKTFNLRNYQLELVEPALEGKNTIICAPTGSGKTLTSCYIMQRHLEKKFTGTRRNMVVFLVNQRPLVEQQGNVFQEFLAPKGYRVIQLTGETVTIPLSEVVEEGYDVIVLTAQVLENALRDNIVDSLSVFTMMVFDECHHCQKLEPYNCIMGRYRDMKIDQPNEPRPQIIGLTASLGVGKARTPQKAVEHIVSICANLDADTIATVLIHKNELAQYVAVPEEELLSVQGRAEDPFARKIIAIMCTIEKIMQTSEGAASFDQKEMDLRPPSEQGTQAYEQWVVQLGKTSAELLDDKRMRRVFKTCTDHLRKYNDALFVNKDVRTKDALDFLNRYFDKLNEPERRQGFDKLDTDLFQLFQDQKAELEVFSKDPSLKNPLLEKLGFIIRKAYTENENTRGIVLTKTRASCYALKNWIEETGDLKDLNPGVLIGGGRNADIPGMNQPQQNNLLEMFQEGNHRIIICTSVGQEGIDIKLCNLVLRYNYANNEIGRVQAKGRNRVKDGKVFLLAGADTRIKEREELNMMRENMMYKAISEVKRMTDRYFTRQIQELQREDQRVRHDRAMEKAATESKRKRETPREAVKFLCGICNDFACWSTDFREFKESHHLLLDDSFTERVTILAHKRPQQIDEMYKHGKVHCKKCKHDWGIVARIEYTDYPILKISSFILVMPTGTRKVIRKWKDAPFHVEPFTEEDKQKVVNTEKENAAN